MKHFTQARDALARQFSTEALGALQAAELLWQAKLAGHPSDYLEALYAALLALEPGTTLKAAQHIAQADIGYLCLATYLLQLKRFIRGEADRYHLCNELFPTLVVQERSDLVT